MSDDSTERDLSQSQITRTNFWTLNVDTVANFTFCSGFDGLHELEKDTVVKMQRIYHMSNG